MTVAATLEEKALEAGIRDAPHALDDSPRGGRRDNSPRGGKRDLRSKDLKDHSAENYLCRRDGVRGYLCRRRRRDSNINSQSRDNLPHHRTGLYYARRIMNLFGHVGDHSDERYFLVISCFRVLVFFFYFELVF